MQHFGRCVTVLYRIVAPQIVQTRLGFCKWYANRKLRPKSRLQNKNATKKKEGAGALQGNNVYDLSHKLHRITLVRELLMSGEDPIGNGGKKNRMVVRGEMRSGQKQNRTLGR